MVHGSACVSNRRAFRPVHGMEGIREVQAESWRQPRNVNIMYLLTGDGDAGDNYSVGLLKSTDAGATWAPTGLSIAMGTSTLASRVLINPNNTSVILVATSSGVYRSMDAGVTFTRTLT